MKNKLYYILIATALIFYGCDSNDGECRKDLTVKMGVALYQMVYNSETGTFNQQTYTTKLTVYGLNNDSILYKEKELSSFEVPLKKTEPFAQFVLKTESSSDTITVLYTNTETFISLECGCQVTHALVLATTTINAIDSVGIRAENITTTGETHLNVYYHVK